MDVIKHADELKIEADNIITECDVVGTLSGLGKINFVGSYALNLLHRNDIDIIVTSDICSRDLAISATQIFLENNKYQTVGFADYVNYNTPYLQGYYWELIVVNGGVKWKFDVWYTAEKKIKTIEVTQMILDKLTINKDARRKILELKQKYFDGEKYSDDMNGIKIYEKVLEISPLKLRGVSRCDIGRG